MTRGSLMTSPALDRRRFLTIAGAAGALGGAASLAAPGSAWAAPLGAPAADDPEPTRPLSFAVLTDTHANALESSRLDVLRRTFASIERAAPTFVLNCGDITDYGGDDDFDAYLSTIPAGLRDRLHHVPGNHEVRWDVHGAELYHRLFGPTPYSFDAAGLHVVGLDPTQLLQEPGHFGREHLDWLARDLRRAGPSVLFLHYPFWAEHYYVNDQDAFFETIADLPVRAIFAGHIHREQVVRTNGLTQVAANAVRNGSFYYWAERTGDVGHDVLRVSAVAVAADGSDTRRELTTIPLGKDPAAHDLRPRYVEVSPPAGGAAGVAIRLPAPDAATAMRAQVYPQQVFGGGSAGTWVDLARSGRDWSGTVDVGALAAGTHRLQVRVVGTGGAQFDVTEPFTIPAGDPAAPREGWHADLPGSVQGALAHHGELVVAATTTGAVEAFRPHANGRTVVWQARTGAVHRGAAFDAEGGTLYIPSADHHLYALRARDGRRRWRFEASDPVLSTPLVTSVQGVATVIFSAGRTLYAVDAGTGARRWSSDLRGFFAGRAACDGERVYVGAGDGNAYAFDAATGTPLWTYDATTRQDPYGRLLYGPWDDVIELLPGGAVLVATVSATVALDRASGQRRWSVAASCMYTPSLVVEGSAAGAGGVLLTDEFGRLQLVDPATGVAVWKSEVGTRAFNAGPVRSGETMWIVTATGLLAGVDVATGTVLHRRQLGPANTFSTPVLVDGVLVTGDQDGRLRGIDLP
ncbi:PQQ-binding-like beta-propeller repeat protein [Actinopolymorpha pittospori]|uniref:Outer membrane protein assembly factor BamB n=1 Tax=Actinopolymorpha pittospori TaxID=648752 RepID=A0A927N6R4_9ACTN|nr:PQQ-binding-like beta-propeller repeat protein [Actinopolymorpha pittospori]MBE1611278.1 outer membrane protein assembly factor BamB [Actinopolymorpha pittospori]